MALAPLISDLVDYWLDRLDGLDQVDFGFDRIDLGQKPVCFRQVRDDGL
jgi:hypothetical protein